VIVKVILSIIAGLFILVPLCYLPASFVTFLVKERTSKSKHLQMVSSVSPKLYWIATYIWDYFLYSILMMSIMATLFGYSNTISNTFVSNASATTAVFLLLASYGFAVLPLSYLYSMLFDNHSTAQISITVVHFISGFIFVIAYYITISIPEVAYIGRGLIYFFWFFPTYNVGAGLLNVSTTYYVVFLTGVDQR
jgi:ATP-binding cassette, subfamily A (ABC1), member 3